MSLARNALSPDCIHDSGLVPGSQVKMRLQTLTAAIPSLTEKIEFLIIFVGNLANSEIVKIRTFDIIILWDDVMTGDIHESDAIILQGEHELVMKTKMEYSSLHSKQKVRWDMKMNIQHNFAGGREYIVECVKPLMIVNSNEYDVLGDVKISIRDTKTATKEKYIKYFPIYRSDYEQIIKNNLRILR